MQQLEAPTTPAAMREREDIETYLVGRFRPLLTGQQTPWYWPVIEIRRPVIERALARQPNPSSDEIAVARRRLDGLVAAAERNRELAARGRLGWPLLLFVIVMLVAAAGVVSVVSAFLAKSGAGLRLLGIGVVNREESEVSRGRAGARAAVAWATGIASVPAPRALRRSGPIAGRVPRHAPAFVNPPGNLHRRCCCLAAGSAAWPAGSNPADLLGRALTY